MKKRVFSIIFSILFIVILVFQYSENYRFRIKPPSEEWSKEVLIGTVDGGVKTYPKILNYSDKSYLLAYQNGENINAKVIDTLGKSKNEIVIPVGDKFIRCLNLLSDGENTYINWITTQSGIKTMHSIKVDRNFKIIEQNQEKDIMESTQIDDSILVLTYKDKIVIKDIKNNLSIEKNITNPALVSGVNTNKGYLITYHEEGKRFKYFFAKDGVTSDVSLAASLAPDAKGGYFDRTSLGTDGKYAYLMVETKTAADRFGIIKCITFSLDGKEQRMEDLKVGAFRSIFGSVAISSGDVARFTASCTRYYERKASQEDIIDFTIKNGEVIKHTFASRTNEPSMYSAGVDNALIFFNFLGTDDYDIYMTSMNKEFKDIHNVPRDSEKSRALTDTSLGFIYSIVFIFLFGLKWIVFGMTAICGMSYFAHAMRTNVKKILFVLSYVILAVIKVSTIYGFSKTTQFPDTIKSPVFIIGYCVGISLLCLFYGYRKYKNNMEDLPLWSYIQAIFIDTLLTQMVFIPFIY